MAVEVEVGRIGERPRTGGGGARPERCDGGRANWKETGQTLSGARAWDRWLTRRDVGNDVGRPVDHVMNYVRTSCSLEAQDWRSVDFSSVKKVHWRKPHWTMIKIEKPKYKFVSISHSNRKGLT